MQQAPIPNNEQARQLSVDELDLDALGREECFDRVTRLASTALRTPMGAFSVISGDRQIFKSAIGLPGQSAPRSYSFCGHTILDHRVVAIDDAQSDPRFRDNPLVLANPGIRYYIGAPVRAPGGANIGVVCAMDREPRHTGEDDRKTIADLAHIIENELLLRSMVIRDAVTGFYAQRSFCGLADRYWRRGRSLGTGSGLILFALDGYLNYCRTHGRHLANDLLKQVAGLIEREHRGVDRIVGRLHDDRFAIFALHEDEASLRDTADALRAAVEQACSERLDGDGRAITLCAGVASDRGRAQPDRGFTDLLERAHRALNQARAEGGNRVLTGS